MACDSRFTIDAPERVKAGRLTFVRVLDRWGLGDIKTRLCLRPPDARRLCRSIAFAEGATGATRRFRLKARGRWRVELQVGDARVRSAINVGVRDTALRKSLPTLLATGDSTMEGVDSYLADELHRDRSVARDVRPGASLSGPFAWSPIANSQVARPRATAGARPSRPPVNSAIVAAGEGLAGVRVLWMDLLFSPRGYSRVIRYHGEEVAVREADGIHLNVAGQAIEARVVADAVREPQS